jgi:hypothetical protein
MSLDVYLRLPGQTKTGTGIFIRADGCVRELSREEWNAKFPGREPVVSVSEDEEVYWANITHNLNTMADKAGLYKPLWRPDEIGITRADQLLAPLRSGLERLRADPEQFRAMNPPNGWGDYDGLVRFVEEYLAACERYPHAAVSVSR